MLENIEYKILISNFAAQIMCRIILQYDNFSYFDGIDLFSDVKVLQEIFPKDKKTATNILNFIKELNCSKCIYCI